MFGCLLNPASCIEAAAWRWWDSLGFPVQALIVLGLLAIMVGVSWSLLAMLKRLGGWPAVAGSLAVVAGLVLAFLPKKPKDYPSEVRNEDPPLLPFGKKRIRTARRTPGKRRYNPDSDRWE
jgi:vacuolar-type H+-ATPase subunit I/STV1